MHRNRMTSVVALMASVGLACAASAQGVNDPVHTFAKVTPIGELPVYIAPPIDFGEVIALDALEASENKPFRFALANEVAINPANDGLWEVVEEGKYWVWRLRVVCENSTSLNFGFFGYQMPEGGRMLIYPTGEAPVVRPFTESDNADHGQLWTPVVLGNDAIIEVLVPADRVGELALDLGTVNTGFRGFEAGDVTSGKSGSCNVDVVCPQGIGWENEISASGAYTINGTNTCSGSMINNTDGRDYFLTARHCGVSSSNAASIVIYWNYQNSTCRTPGTSGAGGSGNGTRTQFNSGTTFRGNSSVSDFALVELNQPINPSYMVSKAGWDRSGAEATTAVAIHHPRVMEKRISFEYQPTTTTSYLGNSPSPSGTHVRVADWDLGTTEPGSSGSPLFDQNKRIIGQLHGGYAACGNDDADWYGRVSVSWSNGLGALLDPGNTGLLFMDTDGMFEPNGMRVDPTGNLNASGPVGGPFTNSQVVYTIENINPTENMAYEVTTDAGWLSISNGSGTVPGGGSAQVIVAMSGSAVSLGAGRYEGTVTFTNLTDGVGNTTRDASVDIGAMVYNGPGFTIVDNTTVSRTITVPDSYEISSVEVNIDVSHTWVGDLTFTINHNGVPVKLVDRPGRTSSGFGSNADINGLYTFSDLGSVEWENLSDFPPGMYLPFEPLAAFNGMNAHGDWTLSIQDSATGDTGVVNAWSLRLVPVSTEPNCLGDIADDFGFTADEGGGPDGVVDFGDFVALLGLIGPCDGGAPGCLGDIADDFGFTADEGGGPDGVVDFGDFVALLGLIGPCD